MGIMRWRVYNQTQALFPNVHLTYGYLTKHTRISHKLEKSHLIDARCISGNATAQTDGIWYLIRVGAAQQSATAQSRHQKRREATAQHGTQIYTRLSLV